MADEGALARVMLVDDSLVIRSILTKVLDKKYQVVGDCGNGAEAIEMAREFQPDVILMDVTMPIMDGIEATREIHSRFPEIDIVILSAVGNDRSMYAGLAAGARDYLVKPVKARDVLSILGRLDGQRAHRRATGRVETIGRSDTGLWAFCGPQGGGDGRSTLVLSVANELLAMGRKVVVLDADPLFGDLSFYLRPPPPEVPFEDLLKAEAQDPAEIRRGLSVHPSGLLLGGRPPQGAACLEGTPERLLALARNLRKVSDYVLVDLPGGLPDMLLPLLDESRYIFPVASSLPERLRNMGVLVELLRQCGFAPPRLWPLLTRSGHKLETLGIEEAFPDDSGAVQLAQREAMPVTRVAPRSPYTQKVREFLGRLLQVPVEAPAPGILGGLFQRLRGL